LVTLVGNLVDNAIDAASAEAPGWVEVTVRGTDQALTVAVADSGPGMSADAFQQARMRGYSTKEGERGLGLALVWQVIAGHGGTITSENTYGSVITATIPAAQPVQVKDPFL
jgi:sensor histidine kinase regulating citrate/malate metabolism